jgi:hypothetical protein
MRIDREIVGWEQIGIVQKVRNRGKDEDACSSFVEENGRTHLSRGEGDRT